MLTTVILLGTAVALAAVIFLINAALKPDTFSCQRSVIVAAPPEAIFPLVADPVTFNAWNPFNEDPSITGTYSGPPTGPGARYAFASPKAGTGYTEIVEEHAPRLVVVRLVMTKPMTADNRVEFRLEPVADGTRVTWAMSGRSPYIARLVSQIVDCERMCTDQFTRGLAKLKTLAEQQALAA